MRCNCNASDLTAGIQLVSKWQNEYVFADGSEAGAIPADECED